MILPGNLGFGVGICNDVKLLSKLQLSNLPGNNDINSPTYGNYLHSNGSVMVYIPRFYYRIGNSDHELYLDYNDNLIEIDDFDDKELAESYNFKLHRAFIDGGDIKEGFFIDKYLNNDKIVSKDFSIPITLSRKHFRFFDVIDMAKSRGNDYSCASIFMYAAIGMLTIAHGQFSTNDSVCAWYDINKNFPRGCNNGTLGDSYDTTVHYSGEYIPLVGSASNVAKTSHNGQLSGIVDVNGVMWEIALGLSTPAINEFSTTSTSQSILYLKEKIRLADITADWNMPTSHWGKHGGKWVKQFNSYHLPYSTSKNIGWDFTKLMFAMNNFDGVLPAIKSTTNSDVELSILENMITFVGGCWHTNNAGIMSRKFYNWDDDICNAASFRCAVYD